MRKYIFDEIAINSTEKKKPEPSDKATYIGLEHLDSGSLQVKRFGAEVAPVGEKLVMKKGDVLFGKRRAYQKKVAVAPFDGIFSAHGMVLRPKTDVIDKDFFPLFIASDYFLNAAIKISVGSLSPTINWNDLKLLEFSLPPLEEQRKLAKVLWAAIELKEAYQKLLAQCDEMASSRFIEMFGDIVQNDKNWPVRQFNSIASSRLGKMLDAKKQTGQHRFPYLANCNVQWFHFDISDLKEMDFDEADQHEFELRDGDLLVCEGGEIGRCAVWHDEIQPCYFQKAIHRVRCNLDVVLPDYLTWWFKLNCENNAFQNIAGAKATIAHLPGEKLKKLQVTVPPIGLQRDFVSFLNHLDKSKVELQRSIASLESLMKTLSQDIFT